MVSESGYLRRHESALLLVGAIEPEVQPWLRAAGHECRAVADAKAALKALAEAPAQLIIVDRRAGRPRRRAGVPRRCATTPASARRGCSRSPIAATAGRRSRRSTPAPTTTCTGRSRAPSCSPAARAGLRAAQQRSDDTLLRALMVNVPGAIYRSAWHADHTLELISDEIERISGYPPENFIASAKRTIMSIIHPDDREQGARGGRPAASDDGSRSSLEYRIVRADGAIRWVLDRGQLVHGPGGRLWMDGAIFDITERREAEEALRRREVEAGAHRRAARLARPASSRPPTPRGARSSATSTTAPSSGS